MGKRAHHPRRGSLGYSPRKRAASPVARVRSWIEEDRVRMQGFTGYKAGVTHVVVDDGEEKVTAATIIEAPPIKVCGVRAYGEDASGGKVIFEVWSNDVDKELSKVFPLPKKFKGKIEDLEKLLDQAKEIRLIVHTQPKGTSIPRKKPEIMEYHISGTVEEAYGYAKEHLGKEIRAADVFEEGESVDVASITKGKGFQGPVKKWGVKILPRKTRKGHRTAGTLGPWHPAAMMWRVPQGGQMGYHQRTELNKRILKIGDNGEEVTPKGGFMGYGIIKGDYVMVKGSIPGSRKRLVRLRPAIRPHRRKEERPRVTYISTETKQGVMRS